MRALTGMISAKLYCFVSVSISGSRMSLATRSIFVSTRNTGQSSLRIRPEKKFVFAGPVAAFRLSIPGLRSQVSGSAWAPSPARAVPGSPARFQLHPPASHPSAPAPGRASRAPRGLPAACGGRVASRACARPAYPRRRSAPPDDFLARRHLHHARDAIARGLRLGRDNGDLLAGERVQQRAFAGVGPAENGDKSRFQMGESLLTRVYAD